jgi:hypothetical protein
MRTWDRLGSRVSHTHKRRKEKKEQEKAPTSYIGIAKARSFRFFYYLGEKRNGGFGLPCYLYAVGFWWIWLTIALIAMLRRVWKLHSYEMRNREGKETYLALQLAIYITYLNLSYLDLLFAKYGYNLHLDRLPNLLNYLLSILLSYGFACAFLQCNHFLEL